MKEYGNKNLLVVDKSEKDRKKIYEIFHDDYIVYESETCKEAIDFVNGSRTNGIEISVILLDLTSDDDFPLEFLVNRQADAYFSDIPVVVIISPYTREKYKKAMEYGANDFIVKPFVSDVTKDRVGNVYLYAHKLREMVEGGVKYSGGVDSLTGLYNRTTAIDYCTKIIQESPGELHGFMVMDIDEFSQVNDFIGNLAGDHILRIISSLILTQFRKNDVVARIGGNQFVVMMRAIPNKDIALRKAENIVRLLRYKPNLTIPTSISISIGLTFNEKEDYNYGDMFLRAKEALDMAKTTGKGRVCMYGEKVSREEEENKPIVMTYSKRRNVLSSLDSVLPKKIRHISVDEAKDFIAMYEQNLDKVILTIIDICDEPLVEKSLLYYYNIVGKEENTRMIALCYEGQIDQYMWAFEHGAMDIILIPIDEESAKRRIVKILREELPEGKI